MIAAVLVGFLRNLLQSHFWHFSAKLEVISHVPMSRSSLFAVLAQNLSNEEAHTVKIVQGVLPWRMSRTKMLSLFVAEIGTQLLKRPRRPFPKITAGREERLAGVQDGTCHM